MSSPSPETQPDIRPVTDQLAVAPQLQPEDMATAAAMGFRLVINNRPDAEQPGQPDAARMQAAAEAAGLSYRHIPIIGRATPDQLQQIEALLSEATGPVLAFCRSGTRSITAWATIRALAGDDRFRLAELARNAGYDLSGVLGV
jgi:uncharacterized protein (TIGR01244 family)